MIGRLCLILAATLVYSSAAQAEWQQAKTKHFVIYADEDPGELRNYATRLERFDQAVRISRNMSDPPLTDAGRLTIFEFKDVNALNRVAETGSGVLGLYLTRASGSYAFVAKAKPHGPGEFTSDIVFFHEYAHHLMLQDSAAYYPPWLVEGFAEFLSTAVIGDDGRVTLGAAADHRSAGIFAPDHDFPVSAMVSDTDRRLNGWQWELLYSRGWLLTHYLTFEPSRKGQLARYVDGIRSGLTAADSAKAAFGDLLRLDRDLDEYARRDSLTATIVQTDASKIGPIRIRSLSEAEAAAMPVRMQSTLASRVTADRIAGKARRIAAKFPNSPIVLASLAEAEHDARHYPAAIAAADRALAVDPKNVRALIYRGRSLMQEAKENRAAADWDDIRGWFIRANHVDPENPEPLMLFYQSYQEAGVTPTASAVKGMLYALVLAPQDDELRLMAVRQLLADGRVAEARTDFAPLAFNPHAREFHDTAQDILIAIEASDPARGMSLIDEWKSEHDPD